MEAYFSKQASNSLLDFSGIYRQRGSGFGTLDTGIGRVALPLARRVIWTAEKKNRKRIASARCTRVIRICKKEEKSEASSEEYS